MCPSYCITQFWTLYLREVFGLDPTKTQIVMLEVMLSMIIGMPLANLLARVFGRQITIVLFRAVGVWAMYNISLIDPEVNTLQDLQVFMAFRMAGSMSARPLLMSTFADIVPSDTRARYMGYISSLGVIGTASTLLGGQLIDAYGYGYTFKITAITCGIDVLIHASMIPFLPRFERPKEKEKGGEKKKKNEEGEQQKKAMF